MFEVRRIACGSEDLTQYTHVNWSCITNSGTIYFQDASLDILVHATFM